jgi:P27 family predicted phage terminase small subunit
LKLVTGNRGRRPLNENEPKFENALPIVPEHLSDEAKVEWGRIANELHEAGMLTRLDRAGLAAYCQAYADWVDAERNLKAYGKVLKYPSGPQQSPYLAMRNKALELMLKFGAEFGMTPSSRSRVSVPADAGKNDPAKKYIG